MCSTLKMFVINVSDILCKLLGFQLQSYVMCILSGRFAVVKGFMLFGSGLGILISLVGLFCDTCFSERSFFRYYKPKEAHKRRKNR